MAKKHWLMKTEPDTFSIQDLQSRPGKKEAWDGVRSFQARNFMKKEMSVGDDVLFYHSSCVPPGIVGLATIASEAREDPGALNPKSKYFDPRMSPGKNHWVMVDVVFKREFKRMITLDELRKTAGLETMLVIKRGMRLSIQPVSDAEFEVILKIEGI